MADLGYNKESASKVLRELRVHNWVDKFTDAVFIEFTLILRWSSSFVRRGTCVRFGILCS